MATRRDFMIAMAAATAGGMTSQAASGLTPAPTHLDRFLVDRNYAQAASFARRARSAGGQIHEVCGDATPLWRRVLDPGMGSKGRSFAGLTCPTALFCLERMAWDRGMRVMFRIDHAHHSEGRWRHISAAPISDVMLGRLIADGDGFGRAAFDILLASGAYWGDATNAAPLSGASSQAIAPLTSWVIAPPARA